MGEQLRGKPVIDLAKPGFGPRVGIRRLRPETHVEIAFGNVQGVGRGQELLEANPETALFHRQQLLNGNFKVPGKPVFGHLQQQAASTKTRSDIFIDPVQRNTFVLPCDIPAH